MTDIYCRIKNTAVRLALSGAAVLLPVSALAVPAPKKSFIAVQPDGSEISLMKVGDERAHFLVDNFGRLVTLQQDGNYCYAEVDEAGKTVSSGIPAGTQPAKSDLSRFDASSLIEKAMSRRSDAMQQRFSAKQGTQNTDASADGFRMLFTDFPSEGVQKALVVLVEYQDVKFTVDNPRDYFNRMLNEEGYSERKHVGSARDFFVKSSEGQFLPDFDVFGPVTLSKSMAYYGKNGIFGDDENAEEMIIEGCRMLDPEIDFSQYDRDGDGVIDNVYVFYAGFGEADTPVTEKYTNTVWPHAFDLGNRGIKLDGKLLNHYACSNELAYTGGSNGTPVGIGTFCHEFSHVMGLPDLYSVSYNTNCYTPGTWSTLDEGPYNGDGCVPPLYSAFERFSLGWIKPKQFLASREYTVEPIADTNSCYIAFTAQPTEFFLFENRERSGFDKYLPGSGMLVWHIDYKPSIWKSNVVNNTGSHQYVDLVEANGNTNNQNRSVESFPGSRGIVAFTTDTRPAFVDWNRKSLGLALNKIHMDGNLVKFNVSNDANPTPDDPGSAVEEIASDGSCISVSGQTVSFSGTGNAEVFHMTGRRAATIGSGSSAVLEPGIYAIRFGSESRKLIIR